MYSPTPDQARALGGVLRAMREATGLSVREVAGRLGMDHSTFSRFERGERVISAETLANFTRLVADEINRQRAAA